MDNAVTESRYLKPVRERKIFYAVAVMFFFSLFVMPQYFGLPVPLFDLTILRIMIIMVIVMILADRQRKNDFVHIVFHSKSTTALLPYLVVILYTMGLRADINAFLNPFLEILSFYLLIYIIKSEFGVEKTIRYIIIFAYILSILGVIEFVMGKTPFAYLETIKGLYTGAFIRSGYYRIMGPCTHSLGYGLLLVTIVPITCIDLKKNEINLFQHGILLILLGVNVFLTGSRSTLSVFILELFLLCLFSPKEIKKKIILIVGAGVICLFMFVILFKNTGAAQYILLQITTIIDELFGTQFSLQYGANEVALGSSAHYREQLKLIFKVDWLNPFLGIGRKRSFACEINGSFIQSIDNFYIAEFVRYAYPGLITYLIFLAYYVINLVKKVYLKKSRVAKVLLIGVICYLINLRWVDSLQTLKYLYILFALYEGAFATDKCMDKEKILEKRNKKMSKYIKQRGEL